MLKSGQHGKAGEVNAISDEEYWVGVSKWALKHLLRSDSASISASHFVTYQNVSSMLVDRTSVFILRDT